MSARRHRAAGPGADLTGEPAACEAIAPAPFMPAVGAGRRDPVLFGLRRQRAAVALSWAARLAALPPPGVP